MKTLNFALLMFAVVAVNAFAQPGDIDLQKVAQDVARIKQTLPAGLELAGAYRSDYDTKTEKMTINLKTGDDYLLGVSASYVFTDLNKDGAEDLVVAVERAPNTDNTGWMSFGQRSLQVYAAHGHAADLQLISEGSKVILNGDEGGVFGDPFDGMRLNKKGSIQISHYGGSNFRWELSETFQYREGEVYLIGSYANHYNSGTLDGDSVDTNFLTGDQILTKSKGEKTKETHRKIKVKPLVALPQATVDP